ncbi:MAG: transposase [Planctomycetota bacterium]
MRDPLAHLLTWTTYGTWLSGDARGSFAKSGKFVEPDPRRTRVAKARMTESPVRLTPEMRTLCDATIRRVAEHRGWTLLATAVRSNHVHVVIRVDRAPAQAIADLKAWCTRDLKAACDAARRQWWTERGSVRHLFDEQAVDDAVRYVLEAQDRKDRDR